MSLQEFLPTPRFAEYREFFAPYAELVGRRLATITFGLYASAAYRDKLKAGQTPAFIGFDEGSDFIAEAKWMASQFGSRRFSFRTSSQTTQAAAARAGHAHGGARRRRPPGGRRGNDGAVSEDLRFLDVDAVLHA